jgi:hypothetical protein
VRHARVHVEVARLAAIRIDHVEEQVEVAAPYGREPVAASVAEAVAREKSGTEEPERQHPDRRVGDHERIDVDHAAHAVAEIDGITAGVDLDRAHERGIDRAEDALEILEVKRVVETEAVEPHERLVDVAATDVGLRGEAAGRGPRQPCNGTQRVVAEIGQPLEIVGHELELHGIGRAQEAVPAACHEHLLERPRCQCRERRVDCAWCRSCRGRAAHDHEAAARHLARLEPVRREDLVEDRARRGCLRLALDGHLGPHDVRAVNDRHAARDETRDRRRKRQAGPAAWRRLLRRRMCARRQQVRSGQHEQCGE